MGVSPAPPDANVAQMSPVSVQMRLVQPVAPQGNQIVIAGGLQPGETIVTAGVHTLTAGQKVTLYGEPKP